MTVAKPKKPSAVPVAKTRRLVMYEISPDFKSTSPSSRAKFDPFDVELEGKGASGPFKGPPENKRLTDNTIEGLQRLYPGLSEVAARKIDQQAKRLAEGFNAEATKTSEHGFPEKAPALWAERTTGRKVSPVEFICRHYGNRSGDRAKWEPEGLTRADISRLDAPLYQAYATWIRRHPEQTLSLPTAPRTALVGPADAVRFKRDLGKAATAKYRARKMSS